MKAKHKLRLIAAGALLALAAGSVASAAERAARGPFDAKAREIFEKVISIPTQLGNRKVPEMAAYLAGEFRAAGFPAEDITIVPFKLPDDETAALVVRYRGDGSGGKPILLLAHMDVVTAKASDWVRDPYKLVEENGWFYGRGTYDVKHGVTELTTLFLRLKAEKYVPKRDLIIYFSGDEETSMATTVAVANQHRALIDAEYALNSDGGGGTLDDETGKPLFFGFQTAEKTYADFTLTTRNPGGHSSLPRPDNAIYDLAEALAKLRRFSFPVMWNDTTIAGFRESAKTTPGELGSAMAKFAANPKDELAAATLAANPSYVGQTRTTCVATMLEGGHAQNALPQSAAANVNCRIFPGVKIEDVRLALAGVVGAGVEVTVDGSPMSSDASPLRKDIVAAVTRVVHKFYPEAIIVPQQASGATDGLVFRSVGIPTYGVDPTFIRDKDAFAHGLNERLPVKSFYDGLEMWYLLVKDLAGTLEKAVTAPSEALGTTRLALSNGARLLARDAAAAAEQANEILKVVPDHAEALTLLGLALGRMGKGEEAIEVLRRAVHFEPAQPDAWRALGDHYTALEMREAADNAFAQQIRHSTKDPKLMVPALALSENRIPDAEQLLREHLRHYPTDVAAIRMLAEVAARIGRIADSETLLARCLELAPGFTIARQNYAMMLHRANKPEAALREANTLLADDPTNPGLRNLKAAIFGRIGEFEKSIAQYKAVLTDYPQQPRIWMSLGHALKTAGENAASIDAYRRCIELTPRFGEVWWSLANLKTYRFSGEDIVTMRAQLERTDLTNDDRFHFNFALGKALEDAGEYEESFAAYARGNALRRKLIRHDADDNEAHVARSRKLFTPEFFTARRDMGCPAPDPIFVVGLPRSGSTLIEQILATHSLVEGTQELPDVTMIARIIGRRTTRTDGSAYPRALEKFSAGELRAFGEQYLAQTRIQRKTGRPFFIDKMPNNFAHVGLIHLMLPNARIIDARRHPLGCCLSCFKQHFARGQNFTYDLAELGRYYRNYVELMGHFDDVLPGRVHRVFYESMVEDTEGEVRRLLAYCGLPFEESVLRFHENQRAVRTASSEQVRRPIFREGMDQWRRYEPWLDPLKHSLGRVLEEYPAVPQF